MHALRWIIRSVRIEPPWGHEPPWGRGLVRHRAPLGVKDRYRLNFFFSSSLFAWPLFDGCEVFASQCGSMQGGFLGLRLVFVRCCLEPPLEGRVGLTCLRDCLEVSMDVQCMLLLFCQSNALPVHLLRQVFFRGFLAVFFDLVSRMPPGPLFGFIFFWFLS